MRKDLFGGKWKFLLLTLFILPLSIGTYGCGGGGGDDGGGGGSPAPVAPLWVNYGVGTANIVPALPLPSGTTSTGAAFAFTKLDLSGRINTDTDEITLVSFNEDWQIRPGNGADFTYNPAPPALGGGAINVRVRIPPGGDVRWIGGSDPTEGTYEVSIVGADGITLLLGPFRVVAAPNRPGGAGVYIYNSNDLVNPLSDLSWADFKNAVETSGTDYWVLSSLAYNALQSVYRFLSRAYTLLELVVTYETTLEQNQVVGFSGDDFPGTGAGPANVTVQWLDQNGDGNLSPGDGFMSMFNFWWDDTSGYISNGHLRILDYWENSGAPWASNDVGGNFRFGPDGGLDSDFTEQEPVNNNYDPNDPKTTIGGSVFFQVYW